MLFYHPNTPINNEYENRNGTLLDEHIFAFENSQFRLIERNEYNYELIGLNKIKGNYQKTFQRLRNNITIVNGERPSAEISEEIIEIIDKNFKFL